MKSDEKMAGNLECAQLLATGVKGLTQGEAVELKEMLKMGSFFAQLALAEQTKRLADAQEFTNSLMVTAVNPSLSRIGRDLHAQSATQERTNASLDRLKEVLQEAKEASFKEALSQSRAVWQDSDGRMWAGYHPTEG